MQASSQGTPTLTPCHRLPVLRRNNRQKTADEMVKVLQQLLNKYNFRLKVDGFFGSKTEAAVKEFQQRGNDHNPSILVDGIVGPQTWNALGACIIISEQ
jgi:peptidoglycan hydrolase-like protein with peptidoglycan-binding domain